MDRGGTNRFVIQKHAASRLHYDFRLELDGTLKSWAVPKGVPYAKGEKRLAMRVEDHPVSYIDFEGTIPQGQYGGGTVMVWDRGTFEILGKNELAKGKLHVVLHGNKLEGEWYLVQMRGGDEWLLIRGGSDFKPVSKRQDDLSVISGKNMAQLSRGDRVWQSKPRAPSPPKRLGSRKSGRPTAFIEPMKAKLFAAPPADGDWLYEVKLDGYRALAFRSGDEVRLLSRNDKDFGQRFPDVVEAVAALNSDEFILDGEIVALDSKGRPSFQLLQAFELGTRRPPLLYYVFDLLRLGDKDLRAKPLTERKAALKELVNDPPSIIRYSAPLPGKADTLLRQVAKMGFEGLIGKRDDSLYEAGARSGAWIKLKLHTEQEFVIGGYTDPERTRKHFGALLVGYYIGKQLMYAGKVGTGFDFKLLASLRAAFDRIAQDECPFANLPRPQKARYGQTITASQMKRCHWIKPTMVCQVRFAEWTRDGSLRQPVFLGLREDKEASEVVREKAA